MQTIIRIAAIVLLIFPIVVSKSMEGPWEFKDILNEVAGNSNTNHQSIIEFKGNENFIYDTGGIQPTGSSFRRSVCIDYLYYNADGTMKKC